MQILVIVTKAKKAGSISKNVLERFSYKLIHKTFAEKITKLLTKKEDKGVFLMSNISSSGLAPFRTFFQAYLTGIILFSGTKARGLTAQNFLKYES